MCCQSQCHSHGRCTGPFERTLDKGHQVYDYIFLKDKDYLPRLMGYSLVRHFLTTLLLPTIERAEDMVCKEWSESGLIVNITLPRTRVVRIVTISGLCHRTPRRSILCDQGSRKIVDEPTICRSPTNTVLTWLQNQPSYVSTSASAGLFSRLELFSSSLEV